MDCVASEVHFSFEQSASGVDDKTQYWQLLLQITADFSIKIGQELIFQEPEFPVIEFADQAADWLIGSTGDFEYTSMETEDNPLIQFRVCGPCCLRISSPWQHAAEVVDRQALNSGLVKFMARLFVDLKSELDGWEGAANAVLAKLRNIQSRQVVMILPE